MSCPDIGLLTKKLTFSINCTDGSGVSTDATGDVLYSVFEDENPVAMSTGTMTKVGTLTGFYSEQLDITVANGYELYKTYTVRITGTVDGTPISTIYSFVVYPYTDVTVLEGNPVSLVLSPDTDLLSNIRNDTVRFLSEWGENLILQRAIPAYDATGVGVISWAQVALFVGDWQELTGESIRAESGLDVKSRYQIFAEYNALAQAGDKIVREDDTFGYVNYVIKREDHTLIMVKL